MECHDELGDSLGQENIEVHGTEDADQFDSEIDIPSGKPDVKCSENYDISHKSDSTNPSPRFLWVKVPDGITHGDQRDSPSPPNLQNSEESAACEAACEETPPEPAAPQIANDEERAPLIPTPPAAAPPITAKPLPTFLNGGSASLAVALLCSDITVPTSSWPPPPGGGAYLGDIEPLFRTPSALSAPPPPATYS